MKSLRQWLFGEKADVPVHIQEALDASAEAAAATDQAHAAVTSYWKARRVAAAKVIDEYERAERRRIERRAR